MLGTTNQNDHVLRSNAWSFFSFRNTNQHDHVLRSNAWSCFSFRATNQHDHVLRSNAWSCFSFRTINHMTMSFVVMLGHVYFSGMRPVGPGCVSGQDTLLNCPVLIMYAFVHCSTSFSSFACGLTWYLHYFPKSNPMA